METLETTDTYIGRRRRCRSGSSGLFRRGIRGHRCCVCSGLRWWLSVSIPAVLVGCLGVLCVEGQLLLRWPLDAIFTHLLVLLLLLLVHRMPRVLSRFLHGLCMFLGFVWCG